jgi:hypothetical protein
MGGGLKTAEFLSGRYADILSNLYMGYACLWYYQKNKQVTRARTLSLSHTHTQTHKHTHTHHTHTHTHTHTHYQKDAQVKRSLSLSSLSLSLASLTHSLTHYPRTSM